MTEDEMVVWHQQLNGCEFGQGLEVDDATQQFCLLFSPFASCL